MVAGHFEMVISMIWPLKKFVIMTLKSKIKEEIVLLMPLSWGHVWNIVLEPRGRRMTF